MKIVRYLLLIFKNKLIVASLSLIAIGLLNGALKYKMTSHDYIFYLAGGDSLSNSSLSLSMIVLTMTMIIHIIVGMVLEYGLDEASLVVLPRIGDKSKYLSSLFITIMGISIILSVISSISLIPLATMFLKGNHTYNMFEVSTSIAMLRQIITIVLSTVIMVIVQYIGRAFLKLDSIIYFVFAVYVMNYLGLVPSILSNHLSHYAGIVTLKDFMDFTNMVILKSTLILILLSITLRKEIEIC